MWGVKVPATFQTISSSYKKKLIYFYFSYIFVKNWFGQKCSSSKRSAKKIMANSDPHFVLQNLCLPLTLVVQGRGRGQICLHWWNQSDITKIKCSPTRMVLEQTRPHLGVEEMFKIRIQFLASKNHGSKRIFASNTSPAAQGARAHRLQPSLRPIHDNSKSGGHHIPRLLGALYNITEDIFCFRELFEKSTWWRRTKKKKTENNVGNSDPL